jgi:hypothetical protein
MPPLLPVLSYISWHGWFELMILGDWESEILSDKR